MDQGGGTGWAVVVPVKRLEIAKTRLSRFAGPHRADLALAFAADTVSAALAADGVGTVLVVTDDPRAGGMAAALGCAVTADVPDNGLNAALAHGETVARRLQPGCGVAALSSDLPALRAADLAAALAESAVAGRAFVADAEGTGTTLLAAAYGHPLDPRFGHRSRARHREGGARELGGPGMGSLRRDVDTEVDLYDAVRLGVGPRTRALLDRIDRIDRIDALDRNGGGPFGSLPDMQATVHTYDEATRSGSVLLDDGVELPYDAEAFDAGGLRLLRLGQRVRITVDPAGTRVLMLTLSTFPVPDEG
ncbi:MAG: 2-phospho-L-lactate guanylyltransferase [Actinomycetes bacterium]